MTDDAYEKTMPPPPPPGALVGTLLSERYRIDALLGEGGMGAVYVGEHLLMHKRVAIKVLHPEMMENAEVVTRFEREAMAAAHIDHPNVAAATDFGKLPDGSFFLVLEFLEGTTLRDVLDRDGPMPEARALGIVRQIASALTRAHGLRIVHRDLKPENVMLVERDGVSDFVKVLDFGIAKVPVHELAGKEIRTPQAKGALTQLGVMYGTPEYMAPEQALGSEIDARADLYSLGVVLHEMLAGERPFVSENRVVIVTMHVTSPPPSVRERAPQVSPATEALILQLLAKQPADRVQDARLVVERIDAILRGETPPASSVEPASVARPMVTGVGAAPAPVPGTSLGALPTAVAAPAITVQSAAPSDLDRLRAGLPKPLRDVPLVALAAGAGALALLGLVALVLLVAVLRPSASGDGGRADAPTLVPGEAASDAELAEARTKGSAELDALAKRYPRDTRIRRAAVVALADEKKRADAMRQLGALLEHDKAAAEDDAVLRAVRASAEDEAAADLAFELMEGPLGARGTELLYDLATGPKPSARASKSLAKPDVRERSKAVAIALDFKAASSCDAKKALLPRVREDGDSRVLPGLKAVKGTSGCGFLRRSDCWPCLHVGSELADTIREIEGRADAPAPSGSAR